MHFYVHIPFCQRKCDYCSFYSETSLDLRKNYFEALIKEIRTTKTLPSRKTANTIYFGGGTPSVVEPELIMEAMEAIKTQYGLQCIDEATIEINPNSFNLAKAIIYSKAGFNRISIGVQSLDEEILKLLGRLHSPSDAISAIESSKEAGITNISCDLIIGIPGQSLENVKRDVYKLISMGVKHISLYSLSIEEGTPFYERYIDNLDDYRDPEGERIIYHEIRKYLASFGLKPYEISNSSYPGFESIHNSAYWNEEEYLAFGAASHGFVGDIRYSHINSIRDYIKSYNEIIIEEKLSNEDKIREYAILKLRMTDGIDRIEFQQRFGINLEEYFSDAIKKNVEKGYLIDDGTKVYLSSKGLDFASIVSCDFI